MPGYVNKADGTYQKQLFTIGSETSNHQVPKQTPNIFCYLDLIPKHSARHLDGLLFNSHKKKPSSGCFPEKVQNMNHKAKIEKQISLDTEIPNNYRTKNSRKDGHNIRLSKPILTEKQLVFSETERYACVRKQSRRHLSKAVIYHRLRNIQPSSKNKIYGMEWIDSNNSVKRPKPNDWEGPKENGFSMPKTVSSERYSNVEQKQARV